MHSAWSVWDSESFATFYLTPTTKYLESFPISQNFNISHEVYVILVLETVEVHCQLVLYACSTNGTWEKDLPYCNPHQPIEPLFNFFSFSHVLENELTLTIIMPLLKIF